MTSFLLPACNAALWVFLSLGDASGLVIPSSSSATTWLDLERQLQLSSSDLPIIIDSVLDPSQPIFSKERPTFFRERHGWCPYSERVWITLELVGEEYDTIRIDNTGGPRPSYYGGQTPQMRWPDGKQQGESMDLVQEIDSRYNNGKLYRPANVDDCINAFRNIFPKARPSSRAAFLFQYNGEPLWKSTFEKVLEETDALLSSSSSGPFFCGQEVSGADIAWAPFLERYRYQLPCLHEGLEPDDKSKYPHLSIWYEAMDRIPEYACRVKGDAGSWRKVLSMAGFGNVGIPPTIQGNIDSRIRMVEMELARQAVDWNVWQDFASGRPNVAETPHAEAAKVIVRNREMLIKDIIKQTTTPSSSYYGKGRWNDVLPSNEQDMDALLRQLAQLLIYTGSSGLVSPSVCSQEISSLAAFLDVSVIIINSGALRLLSAMTFFSISHFYCGW
jgi:glutathione S-transferase